jgi:hypothetical protein
VVLHWAKLRLAVHKQVLVVTTLRKLLSFVDALEYSSTWKHANGGGVNWGSTHAADIFDPVNIRTRMDETVIVVSDPQI